MGNTVRYFVGVSPKNLWKNIMHIEVPKNSVIRKITLGPIMMDPACLNVNIYFGSHCTWA